MVSLKELIIVFSSLLIGTAMGAVGTWGVLQTSQPGQSKSSSNECKILRDLCADALDSSARGRKCRAGMLAVYASGRVKATREDCAALLPDIMDTAVKELADE